VEAYAATLVPADRPLQVKPSDMETRVFAEQFKSAVVLSKGGDNIRSSHNMCLGQASLGAWSKNIAVPVCLFLFNAFLKGGLS
jgi:hypothetical protein